MMDAQARSEPVVDEGDPPWRLAGQWRELAPAPGRLGNSLRLVAIVLVTVTIAETFRLSDAAISAYMVVFVSRAERVSTVMTAVLGGAAVLVGIALALLLFMASLSEPALRVPLMAAITFAAMFASRVSPLGPIVFPLGFVAAYAMTIGDQLTGLSLEPLQIGNTVESGLPGLLFLPPEEVLVHFLLWLALAVAIPIGLVAGANLLTGRDPARLLLDALAVRLEAASRLCADGKQGAGALEQLAREGSAGLVKLHGMARGRLRLADGEAVIAAVQSLSLALLTAARLPGGLPVLVWREAGRASLAAASALRRGMPADSGPVSPGATLSAEGALAGPAATALDAALRELDSALHAPPGSAAAKHGKPGLLVPDAWSNPDHARYALKVTLAVMLAYIGEELLDWPGIHTVIITCFFVSLGTVGETGHKAVLRLTGCLIGAALGIGTILVAMPDMTTLTDLLLVLAPVTFLAAWVGGGSERIAYAGWQIGLAFFLTVLQGYGPTLDMETARDRIIGILAGNLLVTIIFSTVWPVRVGDLVRQSLARAVDVLADLLAAGPADGPAQNGLRREFGVQTARARSLLLDDHFEVARGGVRRIGVRTVLRVQELLLPVSIIMALNASPARASMDEEAGAAVLAHQRAMAAWLRNAAAWLRAGGPEPAAPGLPPAFDAGASAGVVPEARAHLEALGAWYGVLRDDIRAILDRRVEPLQAARPEAAEGAHLAPA